MKTSKALKLTKKQVWLGDTDDMDAHHEFICLAAHTAGPQVEAIVKPIIYGLLHQEEGNYITFNEWLHAHGVDPYKDAAARRKVQRTRYAWLNHLIAHYESKGD